MGAFGFFVILLSTFGLPGLAVVIDFIGFLRTGNRVVNRNLMRIVEVLSLGVLPLMYAGFGSLNDCCGDSAVFSPDHQLSVAVVMVFCLTAYFYSAYRVRIATPVVEIMTNAFLFIGIVLNVVIAFHTEEFWMALAGNVPIILLALLMLVKNHRLFIEQSQELKSNTKNKFERIAWQILTLQPFLKYPIILILCLPILTILVLILLLAGQKPDSLVRAFTDTYKHGFSEWDYKCANVECGGHYLCSVAAKGHKKVVKPQRFGVRHGGLIICNRQLLVSNAFEELLQEKAPRAHKLISGQYNKVGNFIHRYYGVFNIKVVSDVIYFLMKPLEWLFLLTLYTLDRNPENRIAKQYLSISDRQQINNLSNCTTK
ncbi:DUF6688 domain-containing protein [Pinibacter soli]|uniref:Uncharacterized protein n=1 Tax=Pinibacter soli TaxID=3044211 RepID=A0ABT6R8E0_9BACT|nr:DUF6688 family protein [Pinibacter soli]MDI3318830.1 hypothetical protein [Pinibacter soli]